MGAVILDNAIVNSNSIVAAGSLIKENFVVPEGVLVAGVPAKTIRDLTNVEITNIKESARNYVGYAKQYKH
jgi:carbonic anhydrase/acetyltransferase-like protein (isoleucine patch superfamily)